jgi:uncharacterized protein
MIDTKEQNTEYKNDIALLPQYSLRHILLIWAAAVIPMGLLGWVVAPALAHGTQTPVLVRSAVLLIGLVWQFVLVMILLYRETGTLRWSTIRTRLWLTTPRAPQTGKPRGRLWWWLVPTVLLTAAVQLQFMPSLAHLTVSWFPFLAEAQRGFDLRTLLATQGLVGAWNVLGVFVLVALFNTVLGEELLFRGFLLPRMAGVFGKADWVMNALLFGLYHLHQPWDILGSVMIGGIFALPARRFRCAWFGIVAHSAQSVYLTLLILGLVLNLAH